MGFLFGSVAIEFRFPERIDGIIEGEGRPARSCYTELSIENEAARTFTEEFNFFATEFRRR